MLKVIKRITRPNKTISFFVPGNEYKIYLQKNYIETGKLLELSSVESNNELTLTNTSIWRDKESFKEFLLDEYCVKNLITPNQEHDFSNNIKVEISYNDNPFYEFRRPWKKFSAEKYFENIQIPDDWNSLEDFVDWFMGQRMPMMIPWNAEVIRSDDAVAICLFRKGRYQVEFYLEYPNMYIRRHAHPRVEVITMELGGGGLWAGNSLGVSNVWGTASEKTEPGSYHAGDSVTSISKGYITLAFQRWENVEEMTSAAVQWKGELQGTIQADLIKSKKPNAIVQEKFADVTFDTSTIK